MVYLDGSLLYSKVTEKLFNHFIICLLQGRMIVLDLQSEQFPQYFMLDQYFGQPFIWCMLHNFGGTLGMFGNSDIINEVSLFIRRILIISLCLIYFGSQRPIEARSAENSTMIGTGLTMEGINQNYVIYELMTEAAWRNKPVNLSEWIADYSVRRYGGRYNLVVNSWQYFQVCYKNKIWRLRLMNIFQQTVYNLKTLKRMRGQYAITRTPSWSIKTWVSTILNNYFQIYRDT